MLLVSAANQSICPPNDLFTGHMVYIHGCFGCWMGFSFSLSTEVRRSLGALTCAYKSHFTKRMVSA